jgi:hypothetical protein
VTGCSFRDDEPTSATAVQNRLLHLKNATDSSKFRREADRNQRLAWLGSLVIVVSSAAVPFSS